MTTDNEEFGKNEQVFRAYIVWLLKSKIIFDEK
jgi:hypothetical protein